MRVLALIGARGGSKGIRRKNLVDLAGYPLIHYTFAEARKSQRLDRIVLSTDDAEIAAYGKSMGIEVPFMRPAELSSDTAVLADAIAHALDWLRTEEQYIPDAILLLHPTSPLRCAHHLDEALALYESEGADTLISVSQPQEHPWEMVWFEDGKMRFIYEKYANLTNRQNYQKFHFINGAIYITRTELFKANRNFWSGRVVPYFMNTLESIDVDTEADLVIADCLLRRRQEVGAAWTDPGSKLTT